MVSFYELIASKLPNICNQKAVLISAMGDVDDMRVRLIYIIGFSVELCEPT